MEKTMKNTGIIAPAMLKSAAGALCGFLLIGFAEANSTLDAIPVGHWYESPNTKLEDQFPSFPAGEYYGSSSMVTEAWSGGAYDTKRDQLVIWGGGHYDYAGNEIYTFDINTEQWNRETDPSLDVGGDESTGLYPDGLPRSRHTYNTIEYVPAFDRFCGFGSSGTWPTHSQGDRVIACFDFDTASWDTSSYGEASSTSYKYGFIVADPVTGRLFEHGTNDSNLKSYDPITAQWTSYSGSLYMEMYTTGAVDTQRHQLVAIGNGQFFVWDLDNPGAAATPARTGDTTMENAQAPGFQYDPVLDKFVAWSGGASVYTLDPDTWHWQQVTPDTGNTVTPPDSIPQGTYGRFKYIPSKNLYVVYNRTDENVFFYRLSAGGGGVDYPTVLFSADSYEVETDGLVQLSWQVTNADSCTASGDWSGSRGTSGSEQVGPLKNNASFILRCGNANGERSNTVTINVVAPEPPQIDFAASSRVIEPGTEVTLSWTSQGADSCEAASSDGLWTGQIATAGAVTLPAIDATTKFTVTCIGPGGQSSQSYSVLVKTVSDSDYLLKQVIDDFDVYSVDDQPIYWLDTDENNSMSIDDSIFSISTLDAENVFAMEQPQMVNVHSHFVLAESKEWTNYRYAGQMRVSSNDEGIGVTFLSGYPNIDAYYRLRRETGSFVMSTHGDGIECVGATDTGVIPEPGVWYQFLIENQNDGTQTSIKAKVWESGLPEPQGWQIDCVDDGQYLAKGTIGVWAGTGLGSGGKYWKDFSVESIDPKVDLAMVSTENPDTYVPPSTSPQALASESNTAAIHPLWLLFTLILFRKKTVLTQISHARQRLSCVHFKKYS